LLRQVKLFQEAGVEGVEYQFPHLLRRWVVEGVEYRLPHLLRRWVMEEVEYHQAIVCL
jgi:ribosomal protein S18